MKASLLIATLISSAVTSVAAGGPFRPFTNKFSRKSFQKWGEYLAKDENLNQKYRIHNGYEGIIQNLPPPNNPKCTNHLKDAKITPALARGRNYDAGKTYYMKDVDQINEVELLFYNNNGKCGMLGVNTILYYQVLKWDTPFFLPWSDEVSGQFGGTSIEDIRIGASDALAKGKNQVSKLEGGFKEVEIKRTVFDGLEQAVYIFKDLKQDGRVRVYVGTRFGTVDWTIAATMPKKTQKKGSEDTELFLTDERTW